MAEFLALLRRDTALMWQRRGDAARRRQLGDRDALVVAGLDLRDDPLGVGRRVGQRHGDGARGDAGEPLGVDVAEFHGRQPRGQDAVPRLSRNVRQVGGWGSQPAGHSRGSVVVPAAVAHDLLADAVPHRGRAAVPDAHHLHRRREHRDDTQDHDREHRG